MSFIKHKSKVLIVIALMALDQMRSVVHRLIDVLLKHGLVLVRCIDETGPTFYKVIGPSTKGLTIT